MVQCAQWPFKFSRRMTPNRMRTKRFRDLLSACMLAVGDAPTLADDFDRPGLQIIERN